MGLIKKFMPEKDKKETPPPSQPIVIMQQQNPTPQKTCKKCGAINAMDSKFCNKCGKNKFF